MIEDSEMLKIVTSYYKEQLYETLGDRGFIEVRGPGGHIFILPIDLIDESKVSKYVAG